MKFDLKGMKKIATDKSYTTMENPHGHQFKIKHASLAPKHKKVLDSLPMMAEGGQVSDDDALIKEKADTDSYNAAHDDNKKEYSWQVEKKMRDTDVTPRKMAEGGEAIPYDKLIPEEAAQNAPFMMSDDTSKASNMMSPPPSADVPAPSALSPQETSQAPQMPAQAPSQVAPASIAPAMPQDSSPQVPSSISTKNPIAPGVLEGYQQQAEGIQKAAEAESNIADLKAKALTTNIAAQQQVLNHYEAANKETHAELAAIRSDIQNSHIDPNHYLGSMDTIGKIGTAIGLVLGGLGGGGRGNQALDFVNNQIDRDIMAQRSNLGKKESLFSNILAESSNERQATEMTRLVMNDMVSHQLEQASMSASSPLIKARAEQAIGALKTQMAPMIQQQNIFKLAMAGAKDGNQMDPSILVPHLVPLSEREAVYKEIATATNTKKVAQTALANFDKVAAQMKSAGGLGRIGVAAYHPAELQALEAELGTTVGEKEGTVRETAMNNVRNAYLPRLSDTAERLSKRREELQNYLTLQMAAPRAKSNGIDLTRFSPTSQSPEQNLSAQEKQMLALARTQPNHPNAQLIFKKLGISE